MTEIYADVVFFVNFIMDIFIFRITAILLKRKVKIRRLVLGGFVSSGLYCLIIFLPGLNRFYNFFSSLFVLISGILLSFGIMKLKEFFMALVYAHISAFAVGGICVALFYYTNIQNVMGNMLNFTIEYFSFKLLITSVCISYVVIKTFTRFINNMTVKKQAVFDLHIYLEDKKAVTKVLVDTGNNLLEPISKYPVVIVEYSVIKDFFPDGLNLLFENSQENDLSRLILNLSNSGMENIFRMIPYKSLGNENGMLLGFKPDRIVLEDENGKLSEKSEVIIGIYNREFSPCGKYRGLISPVILSTSAGDTA